MSASSVADMLFPGGDPCLDSKPLAEPPAEPTPATSIRRHQMVTLVTGEQVPSDSPEWMRECEARYVWAMPDALRAEFYNSILAKRREEGLLDLKNRVHDIEPYCVLDLPTKGQRIAYAEKVALQRGDHAREHLEARVLEIWRKRKAVAG